MDVCDFNAPVEMHLLKKGKERRKKRVGKR